MAARLPIALACALLAAALAACGSTSMALAESEEYYRRADFYRAYAVLAQARRDYPDDARIEKRFWEVRIAYLLKRAQGKVFRNQDAEAVADFEQVMVWDPGNKIAETWIEKAKVKLGRRAALEGDRLRAGGDLEAALRAYHEALTHQPGLPEAEEGLSKLAATWQDRRSKAQDHYIDGVRALYVELFKQTKYHMTIAAQQDPTLKSAEQHAQRAEDRIAEHRFQAARRMEEEGYCESALREYELIAGEHPEFPGLQERIDHMRKECEALDLAREAEISAFRGDYAKAREMALRAFDISVSQRTWLSELLVLIKERELDSKFRKARDLEIQNLLEDALVAFVEIEHDWADYEDVRSRINQLEVAIKEAAVAYAAGQEAEKKDDLAAAIESYELAILYYPGYKGLEGHIGELREKLALRGSDEKGKPPKN